MRILNDALENIIDHRIAEIGYDDDEDTILTIARTALKDAKLSEMLVASREAEKAEEDRLDNPIVRVTSWAFGLDSCGNSVSHYQIWQDGRVIARTNRNRKQCGSNERIDDALCVLYKMKILNPNKNYTYKREDSPNGQNVYIYEPKAGV